MTRMNKQNTCQRRVGRLEDRNTRNGGEDKPFFVRCTYGVYCNAKFVMGMHQTETTPLSQPPPNLYTLSPSLTTPRARFKSRAPSTCHSHNTPNHADSTTLSQLSAPNQAMLLKCLTHVAFPRAPQPSPKHLLPTHLFQPHGLPLCHIPMDVSRPVSASLSEHVQVYWALHVFHATKQPIPLVPECNWRRPRLPRRHNGNGKDSVP